MSVLRFVPGSVVGVVALLVCSAAPALAAGDANRATCPNEAKTGFSSALPDCRAYELVSPVNKKGNRVTFDDSLAGGERVATASVGVLANATSDPDCPTTAYDLARTESGWTPFAVDDAPLSEFTYATKFCAKMLVNGEGGTLTLLRPSSHSAYERDIYRQSAGGPLVPVGPMLPPSGVPPTPAGPDQQAGASGYMAATPDLSHVLFSLQAFNSNERWPGDTTILAPNESFPISALFEYVGSGNTTPTLVGVDNEGKLLSDCGTSPGGSQQGGNRLNVISTDSGRVFFTAVGNGDPATPECAGAARLPHSDELFARIDGTAPQSPLDPAGDCTVAADACTVALSEPHALPEAPMADPGCASSECEANIEDEANFRDANYEGAAAGGGKVFFTSTQQLLNGATQDSDPEDSAVLRNNEKGCAVTKGPNGCNLYEYDFEENPETGKPVGLVLISKAEAGGVEPRVQGVAAVSEDGSHVYFVAQGKLTDTANPEGATAVPGGENLYVTDTGTGQVSLIATLKAGDAAEGGDAAQWQFNGAEPMDVSGNGRYLVFTSAAALTPDDTGAQKQVFRYETGSGAQPPTLVRVSAGEQGYNRDGNTAPAPALITRVGSAATESVQGIGATGADRHPAVSENGAVVFGSSDALTPGALENECLYEEAGACEEYALNIYEYRAGHVYLIAAPSMDTVSTNPHEASRVTAAISESGRDIFFETRKPLAPQDPDTIADIYDAHVEGGFPTTGSRPPCQAEACQGAPSTPVSLQAPSSLALAPPPSAPAPAVVRTAPKKTVAKCAKGKRRIRGKCTKAKPRKKSKPKPGRSGRS